MNNCPICGDCSSPSIDESCDSCLALQKKLDCFYPLLHAAKMALDLLPTIITPENYGHVKYQETKVALINAIGAFEGRDAIYLHG